MIERVRRDRRCAALPGEPFELTPLGESPAMMLDERAALHQELCAMVGQRGTESVAFATDAGWLQTVGLRCAVFGPGSIEVAHRPNEFLPIAEFERAGEMLDDIDPAAVPRRMSSADPASRSHLDRRRPSSPGRPSRSARRPDRSGRDGRAKPPPAGCSGIALLPGFVNAHSHAFQRGLRGSGERFSAGAGSFWSWREAMYALVASLDRRELRRICRQAFAEMRDAGITTRGRVPLPAPRARQGDYAFDDVVLEAASEVGIRIVLLQTYYAAGGIGKSWSPASAGSPRSTFGSTGGRWTASPAAWTPRPSRWASSRTASAP